MEYGFRWSDECINVSRDPSEARRRSLASKFVTRLLCNLSKVILFLDSIADTSNMVGDQGVYQCVVSPGKFKSV